MHKPQVIDIFTDPDGYFKEAELATKTAFVLVLAVGLTHGFRSVVLISHIMNTPFENKGPLIFGMLLAGIGVMIGFVGSWVVYSGILHLLCVYLGGEAELRTTAKVAGYGYLPMVFNGILNSAITGYLTVVYPFPNSLEGTVSVIQSINNHILTQSMDFISILFLIWSGSIWVYGIQKEHELPTKKSVMAVGIVIVMSALWNLEGYIPF